MEWISAWFTTFGLIFAIIDPFGYVPLFLSMTAKDTDERRRKMTLRACITAFIVLGSFTFVGDFILKFFGITIPALQISGGLILLVVALEMLKIFPFGEKKLSSSEESEATQKDDISIVPLAIPMLSGPAAMTTVVVIASDDPSFANYTVILSSIAVTLALTYWVLNSSSRLLKVIGVTGLNVMTRIMGLLLCAMAIQFLINGYTAVK